MIRPKEIKVLYNCPTTKEDVFGSIGYICLYVDNFELLTNVYCTDCKKHHLIKLDFDIEKKLNSSRS